MLDVESTGLHSLADNLDQYACGSESSSVRVKEYCLVSAPIIPFNGEFTKISGFIFPFIGKKIEICSSEVKQLLKILMKTARGGPASLKRGRSGPGGKIA